MTPRISSYSLPVSPRLFGVLLIGIGLMIIRGADDWARSIVVNRRLPGVPRRALRTFGIVFGVMQVVGGVTLVVRPN